MTFASILAAPVLCNGPNAEVSKELREGGGQVMCVEAAGVGKNPSVAVTEKRLLEADAGVFDTGDDAVGVNADKGDDGRAPASDFGLEAQAAGAKFVVGEFIRAGGGALDDVGDAEIEVKKKGFFKGGEEARGESAAVKGGPEAIARAAEVVADGGGVEAGVDAHEEDNEVFGREIRDALVACGKDLGFAGFPGSDQCLMHRAASSKAICGHQKTVPTQFQEENPICLLRQKLPSGGDETGRFSAVLCTDSQVHPATWTTNVIAGSRWKKC
jgi:hypothetical protein